MNWKELKLFDQLFMEGETSIELLEIPLGKRIFDMECISRSSKKNISKTFHYDKFYIETIQPKFSKYKSLIERYNLENTNFDETELEALVRIEEDKKQILDSGKSQKEISTHFFNSAKYLKKTSLLYNAVLKILNVSELLIDEHDQQFLWILHCKCKTPKAIILCENHNQIRKQRLNDIELWHAGGRNTAKLKFINQPKIPLYYLCDWDNKGIEIYQDIKRNIFPDIEIIVPNEPVKLLDINSEWKIKIDYSLFNEEGIRILKKLIPEKWIEEESINHKLLHR